MDHSHLFARVLIAGLLAVFAGCGGLSSFPSPSDAPPAATPAEIPRDMHGGTIAPGITNASIVSPEGFLDSHYAVLTNQSYTRTTNSTTRMNGTVQSHRSTRMWMAANRTAFLLQERFVAQSVRASELDEHHVWANGQYRLELRVENGSDTYRRHSTPQLDRGTVRNSLSGTLESVRAIRVEPLQTDHSYRHYQIIATKFESRDSISNATLSLVIDERGLIHEYQHAVTVQTAQGIHRITVQYVFTEVGTTTIPRPQWIERARDATNVSSRP